VAQRVITDAKACCLHRFATAVADNDIGSLASDFDGFIAALALGLVPRDLRQMGALRAPVADANGPGSGMPAMAARALPFQLGRDVDVGLGDAAAATRCRHLAHHFDAPPGLVACTGRAPRALGDGHAAGFPLVPLGTPEAIAGLASCIAMRETLPTVLLRDSTQQLQPILAPRGLAARLACAQSAPFAKHHHRAAGHPFVALGTPEAIGAPQPGIGLR